jgi:hypothetical protein
MRRVELASTMIASAGYDALTRILEIEFRSGATYEYADVPETEYDELLASPSKGAFFRQRIQGVFPFRRTDPAR